ncbi:MAG TPA: SGNH/GDSL hydrolase family protein, partial [Phototrophicaceae bacterium]|nr:SGNH/GDSL hydrolase family protein [Phototrophicaceae bacterium]
DMSQLHDLYLVPVIPTISDAMRRVYQNGHDNLRNSSYVITKVGDSVSADELYLKPFSRSDNVLGPYSYLADTLKYFGASTATDSVAAHIGMTSLSVFDPAWADKNLCQANESPLDCEYRRKRPSIALIMFGDNDVMHMDDATFDTQMRAIVADSIQHGVIPVLSTFSYDPSQTLWLQSVLFNRRLVKIAADTQVPLINLWLAARSLPSYGLDDDDTHMKHWGFDYLKLDHGYDAFSGAALRNLLSLRTLDEIRRDVILNTSPIPAATDEPTAEAAGA